MRPLIFLLLLLFPFFALGVPSEQDKAILENGSVNILSNPGFEARLSSWTTTVNTTFSIEFAGAGNGKYSGNWTPQASSQFLKSELALHPQKLAGRTCTARINTKWPSGVDGKIIWYVEDSSLQKLSSAKNIQISTGWVSDILIYTCPDAGTTSRVVFESTLAANKLTIDDVQLGQSGTLLVDAVNYGPIDFTPIATWTSNITWTGNYSREGQYAVIYYNAVLSGGSEANILTIDLPDGLVIDDVKLLRTTNPLRIESSFTTREDGVGEQLDVYARFQTGTSFRLGIDTATGTYTASGSSITELVPFTWGANDYINGFIRVPIVGWDSSNVKEAITLETTGWHIDANIGGSSISTGLVNVSSYQSLENSNLDLVINPGSKPAKIACANGTASEGLTCNTAAVNESIGLTFDIDTTGRYRACMTFGYAVRNGDADTMSSTFQLIETLNNSTAIVKEGGNRINVIYSQNDSDGDDHTSGYPVANCSNFTFSTVGSKTIRLMNEQVVGNSPISSNIVADRSATVGQRDIHITVEKMDQQFPTPVFTDLQDSLAKRPLSVESNQRIERAKITTTGASCTVAIQSASWLDSCTRDGVGLYTLNVTASMFSSAMQCIVSPVDIGVNPVIVANGTISTSAIVLKGWDSANSPVDSIFYDIICYGQK